MILNKVHNLNWLENDIPDKSIQLIIADPPYFEVKGSFDFVSLIFYVRFQAQIIIRDFAGNFQKGF